MQKNHWLLIEITAAVLAVIVLAAVMVPKFLTANKNINTANHIPDDNFRRLMAEYLPVEPYGYYTAEQAKEKSLAFGTFYLGHKEIQSMKGIEYFAGVQELYARDNALSELDVSALTRLKIVEVMNNHLTNLRLPKTDTLRDLFAGNNLLSEIDLSSNPSLAQCSLRSNQLHDIDISNNLLLTVLDLSQNQIRSLDLSQHSNIRGLGLRENPITSLVLSASAPVEFIDVSQTHLEQIPDLTPYTILKVADLRGIPIREKDRDMLKLLEERMGTTVVIRGDYVEAGVLYDGKDEEYITQKSNRITVP